jgi:hypothetical protein
LWQGDTGPRALFAHDPRTGTAHPPIAVDPAVAADPAALAALIAARAPGALTWLVPVAVTPPEGARDGGPAPVAHTPDGVLVLIDQGIAFWHPRFRRGPDSVFAAMVYLPPSGRVGAAHVLTAPEIAATAAAIAADPGGNALRALARRFPETLLAATAALPAPDAATFWHGTAVADTMVASDAFKRPLIGIELPDIAGRDWSGGVLQALLPAAIDTALALVPAMTPVTIVLPYAFTGGPQDGSHPAAQVLTALLATRGAGRQVRMVVPAGNHRQDPCAARSAAALTLHVPPDDFSANTLDLHGDWSADDRLEVTLTIPGLPPRSLVPGEGAVLRIDAGGRTIAALQRSAGRLRLATMPTGWRADRPAPAPFGAWTIATSCAWTAAWVLRDDRDPAADGALPRRQSWLEDPARVTHRPDGAPAMTDTPAAHVVRAGTLSVLATATGPEVTGALAVTGGHWDTAAYSGLSQAGAEADRMIPTDDMAAPGGILVLANGGPGRLRVSGTSLSAALAV